MAAAAVGERRRRVRARLRDVPQPVRRQQQEVQEEDAQELPGESRRSGWVWLTFIYI